MEFASSTYKQQSSARVGIVRGKLLGANLYFPFRAKRFLKVTRSPMQHRGLFIHINKYDIHLTEKETTDNKRIPRMQSCCSRQAKWRG